MLDFSYPNILRHFETYIDSSRSESAAFLIWYLRNYYRLTELEAINAVCDQSGDKGVDGIFVDHDHSAIVIFQAKLSKKSERTVGDSTLREFLGTLQQFSSPERIRKLIRTSGRAEVGKLAQRLNLVDLVPAYDLSGLFLSNIDLDYNGEDFLENLSEIVFIGPTALRETYVPERRYVPIHNQREFKIEDTGMIHYESGNSVQVVIMLLQAQALVELDGIENQSLFAFNVRNPLGDTYINREITKSIENTESHSLFPLFHNGITIIAENLQITEDRLVVDNYFVVNGCQSLNLMYENRGKLTSDLRVLTRFIRTSVDDELAELVTKYSNNQNGVDARDLRANDSIQVRLQNEIKAHYTGNFHYQIKKGELGTGSEIEIPNSDIALILLSFDLGELWTKSIDELFWIEKYSAIFARPIVTADRVILCWTIASCIERRLDDLRPTIIGKYPLTRYLVVCITRRFLELDQDGKLALQRPDLYIRNEVNRRKFEVCINEALSQIITTLNHAIAEQTEGVGESFDYRDKFTDRNWTTSFVSKIALELQRARERNWIRDFGQLWQAS